MSELPSSGEAASAVLISKLESLSTEATTFAAKAREESAAAQTARLSVDEQARAIAETKGRIDAEANWFATAKAGAEQAKAAVDTIRTESDAAKAVIQKVQSEVEQLREKTVATCGEVLSLREETAKKGSEVVSAANAAAQHAAAASAEKDLATSAQTKVAELLQQVTEKAAAINTQANQVTAWAAEVEAASVKAKQLTAAMTAAEKQAAQVLAIVEQHEKDLSQLKGECSALHERIESLLPNATSAGLASAFRSQQARFTWPQRGWLITFVLSVISLFLSGFIGLPSADGSWDAMAKHFFNRLPLIAPLVWLAIYAGRHYGLALRLQEEYAYKEAVSAAFEGYKREMSTVGASSAGGPNPLVTLCENVLRTLGQRPGRIYESKPDDITPMTPVANAAKDAMEVATGAMVKSTKP